MYEDITVNWKDAVYVIRREHQYLYLINSEIISFQSNKGIFQWMNATNRMCQDYVYVKWEYRSTMFKIQHCLRHENKVNETKALSYDIKAWNNKKS